MVAYHESFTSGLPKPITPVRQFDSVGYSLRHLCRAATGRQLQSSPPGRGFFGALQLRKKKVPKSFANQGGIVLYRCLSIRRGFRSNLSGRAPAADARGIAQMMRVGLYRPVHVKTLRSQKLRMLLTHRKLLQSKAIAIENDLRGTLRNFGLKVGNPKVFLSKVNGGRAISVVGAEEPRLPLQTDWAGSRTAVAVAVQRSRRSRVTRGLC